MVSRSSNNKVRFGPICRVRARLWAMICWRISLRFCEYSSRLIRSLRSSLWLLICISILFVLDRAFGEQVFLQLRIEARVLAADPFQGHGGVFDLLIPVVGEDHLK